MTLFKKTGADVRSHDDDRILEIDRVAETISQLAVFKDLQQDVKNIVVRFLNLIQQNNRIRISLDSFRLTAPLPHNQRIPGESR